MQKISSKHPAIFVSSLERKYGTHTSNLADSAIQQPDTHFRGCKIHGLTISSADHPHEKSDSYVSADQANTIVSRDRVK